MRGIRSLSRFIFSHVDVQLFQRHLLKIMEGKGIIHNVKLMSRCVDRMMSSLFRERECICRLVCGFDVRKVREFLLDGICFLCKVGKIYFKTEE